MNNFGRNILAILIGIGLIVVNDEAAANKPVKPKDFELRSELGYIVVKTATDKGKVLSSIKPLYFARLDPDSGQTVWNYGDDKSAGSRDNLNVAMVFGRRHWGQQGEVRWYVVPVNPGRWVIAGGGEDTSFSLGSYAFDVQPGKITYVGEVRIGKEDGKSKIVEIERRKLSKDLKNYDFLMNIVMSYTFVLRKPSSIEELPAALQRYSAIVPEFEGDVTFNNALRGLVSRAADLPKR